MTMVMDAILDAGILAGIRLPLAGGFARRIAANYKPHQSAWNHLLDSVALTNLITSACNPQSSFRPT
jgi:hypothetical protein